MNLDELTQTDGGEEVEFEYPFPKFTVGKKYKIRMTSIGRFVDDDNGRGWPMITEISLHSHFKRIEEDV